MRKLIKILACTAAILLIAYSIAWYVSVKSLEINIAELSFKTLTKGVVSLELKVENKGLIPVCIDSLRLKIVADSVEVARLVSDEHACIDPGSSQYVTAEVQPIISNVFKALSKGAKGLRIEGDIEARFNIFSLETPLVLKISTSKEVLRSEGRIVESLSVDVKWLCKGKPCTSARPGDVVEVVVTLRGYARNVTVVVKEDLVMLPDKPVCSKRLNVIDGEAVVKMMFRVEKLPVTRGYYVEVWWSKGHYVMEDSYPPRLAVKR